MHLEEKVFQECKSMLKYALGNGLKVADEVVETIDNYQRQKDQEDRPSMIKELNSTHQQLSKVVAPAKPKTLVLFDRDNFKSLNFLGPVSLSKYMMLIAVLSLVSLIGLSTSTYVNGDPESFGLTTNSGKSLLINQLFLLSAASIGASFATLFQVNQYIKNATYDRMYESTYWVRFVLGILAGSMLATLIPLENFVNQGDTPQGFGRPLLSLVGGFSTAIVFRVLTRLTTAIESIFKGDAKETINALELTHNMKMEQQDIHTKLQLANQLSDLQNKVPETEESKKFLDELTKVQKQLLDQK